MFFKHPYFLEDLIMKIAFIYDTAYPWVTGGAENRIFEIGKRLTGWKLKNIMDKKLSNTMI